MYVPGTRCPDMLSSVGKVDGSSDDEPARPAEASAASPPATDGVEDGRSAEHTGKLHVSKPHNAYEFGQVLSTISARKDEEACAHLLAITTPKDLPLLLSNKLEGDMFLLIIQSLKSHLVAKAPSLVYEHLLHLSRAERFKVSGRPGAGAQGGAREEPAVWVVTPRVLVKHTAPFPFPDDADTD